jgi:hypothetical protein
LRLYSANLIQEVQGRVCEFVKSCQHIYGIAPELKNLVKENVIIRFAREKDKNNTFDLSHVYRKLNGLFKRKITKKERKLRKKIKKKQQKDRKNKKR